MNKLPSMEILGIPVHPLAMSEAVTYLVDRVKQKLVTNVVTANAEIIMLGQRDPEYKQILQEADCVLPDGAGTVWAGRTLGYRVPERVAGFDLFLELIKAAPANKLKVYFFGSAPGIADAAKAKCEVMAPGVEIVGCRNGYFTDGDVPDIIADINASGADMLFVALGAPKQEYWLKANKDNLKPYLRIGLGGSFDVLAGKMARAPKWMQDASLEWLFRLYKRSQPVG
jgi:N-acetylglucosaminyldiphosphoundecaprenol N-acetyl-beta-D-mannosaminyltransferase